MFNIALPVLRAVHGPVTRIARIGAWIFGGYSLLILGAATAADRLAASFPVYGRPLAIALALIILPRLLAAYARRLAARR